MRTLRHAFLFAALWAAAPVAADTETLDEALVLGPLPLVPTSEATPRVAATLAPVPEIDPRGWLPRPGERVALAPGRESTWRRVEAEADGFPLEEPGVYWLAARLVSDRWSELTLNVTTDATLFVDGNPLANPASLTVGRGERFVLVRALAGPDGAAVAVTADGAADLRWDLEPRLSLCDLDRARALASINDLAVSPRGGLVARRLSRRNAKGEGWRREVAVLDAEWNRVASGLGGPDARPLAFSPDGETLLLRRPGESGTDLLAWTAPKGPMHTVVIDEPGLGLVEFSPEGEFLLMASTRGLHPARRDATAPRRWNVLRERVIDWNPLPHLHLVEIATGARRALTQPGDWTLDDAAWAPDGRSILYGRTRPQTARPWFFTEIRRLDLASGEDREIASFTGGWEVRPQAFAPHPNGEYMAFLGPPHQVGDLFPEHSIYNKQVWMLDLETGKYERITRGMRYAFDGGRNLPAWDSAGRSLLLPANMGARDVLVRLEEGDDGWRAKRLLTAQETGARWALSPDATVVAHTGGGPTVPSMLEWKDLVSREFRALETPDIALLMLWRWSKAEDASFTGPGGETIEAWWYRPTGTSGDILEEASVPLIVYFYGGNSPTTRALSTTHQFWAANGYAVLVINPRGAYGYGEAFADHHAGDGGPKAGADVIAGTRALLERFPELDPKRVGCYGGSYGGFLTMYLVANSDLFAAACSMYGIADQATYWGQGTWGWTYGDMANAGALPWRDPEFYLRASPLYQADGINTPLLLLHGDEDANVTPGESIEMFTALQVLGRTVEMVTFPGEDHGIAGTWASYVGHRTMMLEWFDRWLKDQPEAWEHRWR